MDCSNNPPPNLTNYEGVDMAFKQHNMPLPQCKAEGCNLISAKKRYCDKHYRRFQRNGSLDLVRQPPGSIFMQAGYPAQRINGKITFMHTQVAEKALGKKLPPMAVVHHVNEIKTDYRNENLVICQDKNYHNLLHARMRAQAACGNANWLKCSYCKKYDDPSRGTVRNPSRSNDSTKLFYHKECAAKNAREKNARISEQSSS